MIDATHNPTLASSPETGEASAHAHAGKNPPAEPGAEGREEVRWLPPERMARYQIAKVVGALFFIAIFAGWLMIQWSSPTMRVFAIVLLALTMWLTIKSILADTLRSRGRSIVVGTTNVGDATLDVRQPGACLVDIRVADVAHGEWREETEEDFGLTLVARDGRTLVRIDHVFLADQAEARMFLNWLRKHSGATFDVRWPEAE